jgi:hypothetical protein
VRKYLNTLLAGAALIAVPLVAIQQASAGPCLFGVGAAPTCTLAGQTFTNTGATSGGGLTFIANFTTPNQSLANITQLVMGYLHLLGDEVTFLGRGTPNGDTGLSEGIVSITTGGGLSGNWSLNPGVTNFVGSFVAIHSGNGQSDNLFQIDSPGTSGTWATNNGKDLSNFDLFGVKGAPAVPEPASIVLMGVGLLGLGLIRRRRV